MNFKDATGQLARWIDALSEYDFEIKARPGKKNGNADSLSRIHCEGKKCLCEHSCSDPTLDAFYQKPCTLRHFSETSESRMIVEYNLPEQSRQFSDTLEDSSDEELNCEDIPPETLQSYTLHEENKHQKYPFPWKIESMKQAQGSDTVVKHVLEF